MKIRLLIAIAFWTSVAAAADWQAELSPPTPGKFPMLKPLQASYRFGWGGLSAAEGTFEFSRPKPGLLQLQVNARSLGAARALWRMDSQHTATCVEATLRPVSLQQIEAYKKRTLTITADFSPEGVTRLQKVHPAEKAEAKAKRFKAPNLFDLHTALLFVRSQSLQPGERHHLIVYPGKAPFLAKVTVLAREKLKLGGKVHDAIKMEVALQRVTKDLQLEKHEKFKRASAWLSDDQDRLLLKIESEIFVGSVWAELQSVKFAE
ncbi:MAG TPA: DUF3108 domain-containing protein [Chthoniobacteraceae bacterium]|jgi:hypothetical protein